MEQDVLNEKDNQVITFFRTLFVICFCAFIAISSMLFFLIVLKEFVWYNEILDATSYDYSNPSTKFAYAYNYEIVETYIALLFGVIVLITSLLLLLKKPRLYSKKVLKIKGNIHFVLIILTCLVLPVALAVINRAYYLKVCYDYFETTGP